MALCFLDFFVEKVDWPGVDEREREKEIYLSPAPGVVYKNMSSKPGFDVT